MTTQKQFKRGQVYENPDGQLMMVLGINPVTGVVCYVSEDATYGYFPLDAHDIIDACELFDPENPTKNEF